MKRFFLPIVALMAFSGYAKTNAEVKTVNVTSNVLNETESKTLEEDVWFCYLASTTTTKDLMSDDTTTTEIYHCTWYSLN